MLVSFSHPQIDKLGNRLQRKEDGQITDYSYDALYRLLNAADTQGTENFTYDSVGNRLSGPTAIDTPSNAYDYNNAHQMTQGRKFAYSYDNSGNQLTRSQKNGKTWTQGWDAENRLIEVSRTNGADSSVVTFKYDPFGRRIEKQIINSFNGDTISKTVNYVYDAEDIVLQIEEVTHDSTTTTTETRFIHGPGIDEPLAFVRDGQSYFYHADGLGSIVAITDSTQAIAQKYSYESFGLPTPQTTLKQPYMFTGREWDAEIGLYFYRARYYDPMEGRFVSEDPIGFAGGDVNLYNYVGNQPIDWIDPYGYFNPTKGGVAVGNAINAGRLYASGALKLAAAAGLEGTGIGSPAGVGVAALGVWNINSAGKAYERAQQQWEEALTESFSEASYRNLFGLLPFGQELDDSCEPSVLEFFKEKMEGIKSKSVDFGEIIKELGTFMM